MKRKFLKGITFFACFYFFLTLIVFACGFSGTAYIKRKTDKEEENSPETSAKTNYDSKKKIKVLTEGNLKEIELNNYLYGVVAAEMPAEFESEALKAQAVAARTETIKKMGVKDEKHKGADICDDINHCQAYYSVDTLKGKYSDEWYIKYYDKIKNAVDETDGVIITYNDEPITAVFHSTSSGMTENSKDVWGGDFPYLVSVKSEGETSSPRYYEEKSFSYADFKEKILKIKNVNFSDEPYNWFSDIKRNESGSVKSLKICGVKFKGTEIRSALMLRSTNFEISISSEIVFQTKGNGHGVGMSQYGANHLAKMGYTYEEILKKYYTGISLKCE